MKKIKIGDILEIQPKSKVKAGEGITNGKYPFYTCSNELTKSVNTADYEGDALIMGTGGMASIHYEKGKFSTSTDCLVYKSNKNVNLSLINKYLRTNIYLLENGFKGAGLRHISRDYISNITIPLPERNLQDKIVKELDLIEKTITNHNDVLKKYDTLIKSRFIEMFGDEIVENGKYKVERLEELCKIITDGTHQPPKFTTTGIPFLFVSNIVGNKITYETEKFISEETYTELYKRTPIEIGDLLLSTVGSYGHPAIVENDKKFLFQRHIAYLKPKTDLLNSVYFHGALLSPSTQKQIKERVKGIAQKTLNLSEIRKIIIPIPPLALQQQFVQFVQQIDKSKFAVQKSLEKTETLYKSLMQRYFA